VASIDGNGLACDALPAASLTNTIALILRGTCSFESKLNNAQNAGAIAALVYAAAEAPEPIGMNAGAATLPAEMIGHAAGASIKELLAGGPRVGTLSFTIGAVSVNANRRSSFSAAGPNVDNSIKPDLVAAGSDIYTATQRFDRNGDMYSADGFVLVNGTSFSAPIVAGAVALLKSARPGLSVDQYRSLIINNTVDAYLRSGAVAGMQIAGSGSLDALAAIDAKVAAFPALLSFGVGGADPRIRRTLALSNLGTAEDTFYIETNSRDGNAGPVADAVVIAAGSTVEVPVSWNADSLTPGVHEG
jgi:hypothetical protein